MVPVPSKPAEKMIGDDVRQMTSRGNSGHGHQPRWWWKRPHNDPIEATDMLSVLTT